MRAVTNIDDVDNSWDADPGDENAVEPEVGDGIDDGFNVPDADAEVKELTTQTTLLTKSQNRRCFYDFRVAEYL